MQKAYAIQTSDYFTKLDTDEFLHYLDNDTVVPVTPSKLDALPYNGAKYHGYLSVGIPSFPCNVSNNPLLEQRFYHAGRWAGKTIFASATFHQIDLGNHNGSQQERFQYLKPHETQFIVMHYHFQCFESLMENNLKALISHGFVSEMDTKSVMIKKLSQICNMDKVTGDCIAISGHKIHSYLHFLLNESLAKSEYYSINSRENEVNMSHKKVFWGNASLNLPINFKGLNKMYF